ncbi:MAG TPA: hypothetical protein VNR38_00845 [Ureibacillus sp.]|nr:hypothetical protein [Ureibacillus sp.]
MTQEDVIKRFEDKHGKRYDYSLVEYNGTKEKVKIKCKEHGFFDMTPCNHFKGKGCSFCGFESSSNMSRKTTEQFIKDAKLIHGNTYDYSITKYTNAHTKVAIICKIHNKFYISPRKHLIGQECVKCSRIKLSLSKTKCVDLFLQECKQVHGDRYDYSLVEYKDSKTKVKIICKEHGEFKQSPINHLNNNGCPDCGRNRTNKALKENPTGWSVTNWERKARESNRFDSFKVYVIKCWNDNENFYKIGRTFNSIKKRFLGKYNMPYNYEVVKEIVFDNARDCYNKEWELKRNNKELKYIPRLSFNGMQECFYKIDIRD